jgi:hypothetical protein
MPLDAHQLTIPVAIIVQVVRAPDLTDPACDHIEQEADGIFRRRRLACVPQQSPEFAAPPHLLSLIWHL